MNLQGKACLIAAGTMLVAGILSGVLVVSHRQSSRAEEAIVKLRAAMADSVQLRTTVFDFLLYRELRPRRQAEAKLDDLKRFMAEQANFIAEDSRRDAQTRKRWEDVGRWVAASDAVFADLVLDRTAVGAAISERERRSAGLLLLNSQSLTLTFNQLLDSAVTELVATRKKEQFYLVILLCGMAGMGAVLYLLLLSQVLTPLQHMQEVATRIAEGQTELRLRSVRDDEIGQLAAAFDRMLDHLERAEAASVAKDRFLATISHELRTPLNAIIGFTGTLLMQLPGPLNPGQEKQLATIESSARQLLSLINDILDLTKIEAGKVEVKLEPVSCRSVIDEVAASLRPLAEKKGLRFEVSPMSEDIEMRTDRRAFAQIILNLASNAIKYTEQGGVGISCRTRREDERCYTEIRVSDTGVGIRPEHWPRLFQPFTQLDTSSTRRHGGTGLGLYLSQKLAELIGGKISLQSEIGRGSTFTLTVAENGP